MSLRIIDIPETPKRDGSDFDRAVREKLTSAQPVKLPSFTVQDLEDLTPRVWSGYLVRCSNGDAGDPCLAYCDGVSWKKIALGTKVTIS